jgi:hypothetical protein
MRDALRRNPELNVGSFALVHTFKDERDVAHIIDGMRKAGLPE